MSLLLHCRNLADYLAVNYFSHASGMRVLDAFLEREGRAALAYHGHIREWVLGFPLSIFSGPVQAIASLLTAHVKCRWHYRDNTHYPAANIPSGIVYSGYAYQDPPVAPGYALLPLPPGTDVAAHGGIPSGSLNPAFASAVGGVSGYDPVTGHVHGRWGFNAYVKTAGGNIHVAFRGTDIHHARVLPGNALSDIFQLYSCDVCYIRAAGLVHHLLHQMPHAASVNVTGHSLGGGLIQFAVAANLPTGGVPLHGVAFNAAGLSNHSMKALGNVRLTAATGAVDHVTTTLDPVSRVGGLVGGRYRIPRMPGVGNGHGLADVAACYGAYMTPVAGPAPLQIPSVAR